jgi:hypothetical protein
MNRHFLPVFVLVLAVVGLAGGRLFAASLEDDQTVRLADGKEVKALSDEVDEVWKVAETDCDHLGYSEAIISSNEVPRGIFVTASRMYNFIFEKGPDGHWTRLNRADFMASQ